MSDQHSDVDTTHIQASLGWAVDPSRVNILADPEPMPTAETPEGIVKVFSKPRALNRGIEASQGEVLSFLDVDSIVGGRWMNGPKWLADGWWADITRLCFRVRYLPVEVANSLLPNADGDAAVADYFKHYAVYPRAHEGYLDPVINSVCEAQHGDVFGNSQFSIRRETLGSLRSDTAYLAAGYEDLAFIRDIARQAGKDYKGTIRTAAKDALFHIRNHREEGSWGNDFLNQANRTRYLAE